EGVEEGIVRGIYLFRPGEEGRRRRVTLLGSGSIMRQVLRAQEVLQEKYEVSADVYSVTSYQQLRNEALAVERWNRLHPEAEPRLPVITSVLGGHSPIVAASDWLKSLPDQISRWAGSPFVPLGTDGFGRSDTREALRRHFDDRCRGPMHVEHRAGHPAAGARSVGSPRFPCGLVRPERLPDALPG